MLKGLLAAAFVLVCLGVIAVSYVVPNIRVHERSTGSGKQVRVETPFGSVGVNAHDSAAGDVGTLPIYPGAARVKKDSGGAVVNIDLGGNEKTISINAAEYWTDDSVAKVREWYRTQLPDWNTSGKEMAHTEHGVKKVISIQSKEGRTRIGIAVIGGPPDAN